MIPIFHHGGEQEIKSWLIEEAVLDESFAVRKKVDIKYHELGTGYIAQLEAAGLAPMLVTDEEAHRKA